MHPVTAAKSLPLTHQLHGERGMTLVEALVSVLVLSIGLLGVAGLQMASLRSNHSATVRSQASALAYDIVDRMRANRINALTGGLYDIAMGDASPTGTSLPETDLAAWLGALAAVLPAGDGAIAVDAATGVATISIQWDDSRGQDAPVVFVTETRI